MTLQEIIVDLKAAGANNNTVQLAMNCYYLGTVHENEACAKVCEKRIMGDNNREDMEAQNCANDIRKRMQK